MEYKEIITYVVNCENQSLRSEDLYVRNRGRKYVIPRQICMLLGRDFLKLDSTQMTKPFGLSRSSSANAIRHIYDLMDSDPKFRAKIARYSKHIKNIIDIELSVQDNEFGGPGTIAIRTFDGKTVQVENDGRGYTVLSTSVDNGEPVNNVLNLTYEGLKAICDCYIELNNLIISKPI